MKAQIATSMVFYQHAAKRININSQLVYSVPFADAGSDCAQQTLITDGLKRVNILYLPCAHAYCRALQGCEERASVSADAMTVNYGLNKALMDSFNLFISSHNCHNCQSMSKKTQQSKPETYILY